MTEHKLANEIKAWANRYKTNQRELFNSWFLKWDADYGVSSYSQDLMSKAWQAAQADQTATIAQLQLNNAKLREALSAMLTFFGMDEDENNLEIFKLANDALSTTSQPESVVKESLTAQKPDRTGMVYYKNDACKSDDASSFNCICWSKETTQKPLSNEEIRSIAINLNNIDLIESVLPENLTEFVRAIEKAHGIGK
jgi:hypothetical protein